MIIVTKYVLNTKGTDSLWNMEMEVYIRFHFSRFPTHFPIRYLGR